MKKPKIILIMIIIVLTSLFSSSVIAEDVSFRDWQESDQTTFNDQLSEVQKQYLDNSANPRPAKIEVKNNVVTLYFPNPVRPETFYSVSGSSAPQQSPQQASIIQVRSSSGPPVTTQPRLTATPTSTDNMVELELDGKQIRVHKDTAEFLTNNDGRFSKIVDGSGNPLEFVLIETLPSQELNRFILPDVQTNTIRIVKMNIDGSKEEKTEEETFEYDNVKKVSKTNKPVSRTVIINKLNPEGQLIQHTREIFSTRGANFEKKGSVVVDLEPREGWFTGAYRSRTNTVIKDSAGRTLYTIDKDGKIKNENNNVIEPKPENINKIKAELENIDQDLRQEFVDGVVESSSGFGTKFRVMDWSQFFGGFIKSYNEFAGLAHITNLAFDKDYQEKVEKRRLQNSQRFCALAGIGYCFVSNICDKKIDNIGGSATLTQKGRVPSIGVARISGEKSPLISTPKGDQYLYTVNYHLENPFEDKAMTYNIYFINPSGERAWYKSDQKVNQSSVIVVNQASDKPVRKLTRGNYESVCIRFNPSIYAFHSKRTINQVCDVLTKTPVEITEQQVQSVVNQKIGQDGDI